jgi:hypothetical protein
LPRRLARCRLLDEGHAVPADGAVGRHVRLADLGRADVGSGEALLARQIADGVAHLVERPAQVDGGRTLRRQQLDGGVERLVRGVRAQGQAHAVGGGGTDQRSSAHLHGLDGAGSVFERLERDDLQLVRQPGLVDDLDGPAVFRQPDRAIGLALDVHVFNPALAPVPRAVCGASRSARKRGTRAHTIPHGAAPSGR